MATQISKSEICWLPGEVQLWQRTADGDLEARQELVELYQPFAQQVAARLYSNRHIKELEFGDFHHFAVVGLLEAIDRYNPNFGSSFKNYANHRIQGAVLSGVENLCEKQRQIIARKRVLAERAEMLKTGKKHSRDFADVFAELSEIAIGLALGYMLEDSGLYRPEEEEAQPDNAYSGYALKQLKEQVKLIVDALPDQERTVIRHYYFQGVKFESIAVELNLTKGRISQIHHSAMKHLRELHVQMMQIDKAF